MIIRILVIALASLLSFSATTVIAADDVVAEIGNIELLVADNPRKDRRDNRQEGRDDRRDCRQEEGRIGDDKRECKQDDRGEGDDAPEPEDA